MVRAGVAAALFLAVLAVPALIASAITTSTPAQATGAVLSADSSVTSASSGTIPASLLLFQDASTYSLDINGVAPIAATLGTPGEIFHSITHDLINALITILIILFIAFPANIFNQTLSENYEEIQLMKENARRKVRLAFGMSVEPLAIATAAGATMAVDDSAVPAVEAAPSVAGAAVEGPPAAEVEQEPSPAAEVDQSVMPGKTSREWFLATLAVGALFGGLLDPHFGANGHSLESFIATMAAFAAGAGVSWFVAKSFRSKFKYPTQTYLKALPMGLAVAFGCVVVSRLTNFEPGYLYGVVVSISFVGSLKDHHNAHLIVISTMSTLAVALLAWVLWIPLNHAALTGGGNFVEAILDDVLGSMFVGGLIGSVIGLLPLEGLPGGSLVKWRRDVWAGVLFLALFLLVSVELRPSSGPTHPGGAPVVTAIVLFIAFGGLSFGTRSYFAQRKERKEPAAEPKL